jgi:hypothetical protein
VVAENFPNQTGQRPLILVRRALKLLPQLGLNPDRDLLEFV